MRVGQMNGGSPCLLAAEVGINHNGSLETAIQLIDAAREAGADAVKFQNYRTEDFILDRSLTYRYQTQGEVVIESQYDLFKRYELPGDWLWRLKQHCDAQGLLFFSTPTSEAGVAELVALGVPFLKNGSDYLGNLPLIRAMARSGIPTVLSTGMATLAEVDEAVCAYRSSGGKELVLLHCTSAYPTQARDVHLPKIAALRDAFHCPVGLSDHTEGIVAALGAVALGARIVEKHFTLDKNLPGPDHAFSADPQEFRQLSQAVRTLEEQLRPAPIGPVESEQLGRQTYRLSWVAAHDLPEGSRLKEGDLLLRRPGTGLPASLRAWLVGRQLSRKVAQGKVITPEDLV